MHTYNERLAQNMRQYEQAEAVCLRPDMPVVIRVDGRAFKHFTKGLKKPFDDVFRAVMRRTAQDLCAAVPDCIIGYTFSDEISLIVFPGNQDEPSRWFGYNTQKLASHTASMATFYFNRYFSEIVEQLVDFLEHNQDISPRGKAEKYPSQYIHCLQQKLWTATFDSRAFSLPLTELLEYLHFRQMDCVRNSVSAAARAELGKAASLWKNKSIGEMVDMLKATNRPWDSYTSQEKYGAFCVKVPHNFEKEVNGQVVHFVRNKWVVLSETPKLPQELQNLSQYFPAI